MRAPAVPTLREMVAICQRNADLARERRDAFVNTARNLPPGPEREQALAGLSKSDSDYEHWSSYRGYYAGRVAREGGEAVPGMGGFGRLVRAPVGPLHDPRLPREPGDDDEEAPHV